MSTVFYITLLISYAIISINNGTNNIVYVCMVWQSHSWLVKPQLYIPVWCLLVCLWVVMSSTTLDFLERMFG